METIAVRWPAPSGENVTLIVHEAFGANGPLQVLLASAKSPGFAPLNTTEEMCNVATPALVTVIVWAGLMVPCALDAKVRLAGVSVTAGSGATPVPVSGIDCGLPGALSAIAMDARRSPAAVGEKTMLIVQVLFGESAVGAAQVGVALKSAAFAPVPVREFTLRLWFPVSVKVASCELLDCPTFTPPKSSEAGKRAATGPLSA
jgi:hypothetical protein